MKKRQRKKLYKGEFQEMGFELKFHYSVETDEEEFTLMDEFFVVLHDMNLTMAGGYGNEGKASFFIAPAGRGTVTPEAREFVLGWIKAHGSIDKVSAGVLKDVWYCDDF